MYTEKHVQYKVFSRAKVSFTAVWMDSVVSWAQYSTVQMYTVKYSTDVHSTVQYTCTQYSTVHMYTVQYSTDVHSTVQMYTV